MAHMQRFLVPKDEVEMKKYALYHVHYNSRGPIVPRTIYDTVLVQSRFVLAAKRTTTEMQRRWSC